MNKGSTLPSNFLILMTDQRWICKYRTQLFAILWLSMLMSQVVMSCYRQTNSMWMGLYTKFLEFSEFFLIMCLPWVIFLAWCMLQSGYREIMLLASGVVNYNWGFLALPNVSCLQRFHHRLLKSTEDTVLIILIFVRKGKKPQFKSGY